MNNGELERVDEAAAAVRARCGDTFAIHSGGDHYLFTFSAAGVEAFYALPEEKASKSVADYLMLRRKLPDEIFIGNIRLSKRTGATTLAASSTDSAGDDSTLDDGASVNDVTAT